MKLLMDWFEENKDHKLNIIEKGAIKLAVNKAATVGDLLDTFGEENVKNAVQQKTSEASRKPEYSRSVVNILGNWFMLCLFALGFALLSVLVLERSDKDKR